MLYTRRFYAGTLQALSDARAYHPTGTVPAGKVWVLRCVDFGSGATTASLVGLSFDGIEAWYRGTLDPTANHGHLQWTGRQVLLAGEQLFVYVEQKTSVTATGYELGA